ncbi:MAG: DUF6766 family protein [Allosphingosinicella sp.]
MKILRDNGLSIVLLLLFLGSLIGQWIAGWHVANEELARHGRQLIGLAQYATDAQFIAAVFENWESEFLQMSAYVVLTCMLFQRGSAESKDPDGPPRDANLAGQAGKPGAPNILKAGKLWRTLYANSLGLVLFILFILSFLMHWRFSAQQAAAEGAMHGWPAPTIWEHLGSAQLWFESFQNWQSEFLSTALLVLLSIFLRQRESPESKAVAAPHGQTGAE